MQSVKFQPTFRKKISSPSSWSKHKPNKKQLVNRAVWHSGSDCHLLSRWFLVSFMPQNGNKMLLRNLSWTSTDYMALCPRRQTSSSKKWMGNISKWWILKFVPFPEYCLGYQTTERERWMGHVAEEMRNTYRILVRKPVETKLIWRLRRRREDNIKIIWNIRIL